MVPVREARQGVSGRRENIMLDRVFKFMLLAMFGVFLVLYWRQSQNGRYVVMGENRVLDTRVGQTYYNHECPFPGYGPGCVDFVSEHERKK
jgi:hypothetical protein